MLVTGVSAYIHTSYMTGGEDFIFVSSFFLSVVLLSYVITIVDCSLVFLLTSAKSSVLVTIITKVTICYSPGKMPACVSFK